MDDVKHLHILYAPLGVPLGDWRVLCQSRYHVAPAIDYEEHLVESLDLSVVAPPVGGLFPQAELNEPAAAEPYVHNCLGVIESEFGRVVDLDAGDLEVPAGLRPAEQKDYSTPAAKVRRNLGRIDERPPVLVCPVEPDLIASVLHRDVDDVVHRHLVEPGRLFLGGFLAGKRVGDQNEYDVGAADGVEEDPRRQQRDHHEPSGNLPVHTAASSRMRTPAPSRSSPAAFELILTPPDLSVSSTTRTRPPGSSAGVGPASWTTL